MGRNIFRQEEQIRPSDAYVDTTVPAEAAFETNPAHLEDDLNNLRSLGKRLMVGTSAGNWYDDLTTPSTLEAGTQRGVNDLNEDLHAVEKKRFLRRDVQVVDVAVTAAQNWEVLGAGELPANTTIAVGAVTTLGTVAAAHGGTFGSHSLAVVAGANNLNPANLVGVVDGSTRDPITSGGRVVYGLLHSENATDGHTATGTTPNQLQVSFVRATAAGALEACPVADIAGESVNLTFRERVRWEDLNEGDLLNDAKVDVPASATVDRQTAYTNQGTTPVDLVTNAILDLEGAGLQWSIRDDLEAVLLRVTEGSAGGTSKVEVGADTDEFDSDAAANDFLNGVSVDTGAAATTINVGVTANQIDSGGALTVQSAAASDLSLLGQGELIFNDGNLVGEATWTGPGVKLSEDAAEVTAYETAFGGEVSIFNAMVQAYNSSSRRKVHATAIANVAADADVSGPSNDNNLDTDLGDLSGGSFIGDYNIYYNGQYQRPGADAAANHDVYPGTSLAAGQLKFEHKIKTGDEIMLEDFVA